MSQEGTEMMVKRKAVRLGAAVVAATGALVFTAPGAAHADFSACSPGALCMWTDSGGNGSVVSVDANALPKANLSDWGMNDNISSVCNKLGKQVVFYEHVNYGGRSIGVGSGQCANIIGDANDKFSSVSD
jgi:peptidase inhibitor family I36